LESKLLARNSLTEERFENHWLLASFFTFVFLFFERVDFRKTKFFSRSLLVLLRLVNISHWFDDRNTADLDLLATIHYLTAALDHRSIESVCDSFLGLEKGRLWTFILLLLNDLSLSKNWCLHHKQVACSFTVDFILVTNLEFTFTLNNSASKLFLRL